MIHSPSAVVEALLAPPGGDRRRDQHVIRRPDALLHRLEPLKVDAYRPYRPEQPLCGGRKVVRLPADLAQAVNELLIPVGLSARRLRTTDQAQEAVHEAQLYLRPARGGRGLRRLKRACILAAALMLIGCGGDLCPAANNEPSTSGYRNCLVLTSPASAASSNPTPQHATPTSESTAGEH